MEKITYHYLPLPAILPTIPAIPKPKLVETIPPQVITLYPFNYMRRLPLRDGVTVGSNEGRLCRRGEPEGGRCVLSSI